MTENEKYIMRALFNLGKIPKRYRKNQKLIAEGEDLEPFTKLQNFKENIISEVKEGNGLYICSNRVGNGKTSWAIKIMASYFKEIIYNTSLENEGLYIYLPTFLEDLRRYYHTQDEETGEQLEAVMKCKLLIIDDIGAEKPTDWVTERLLSIINTRVNNQLSTIYTSNLSIEQLKNTLGVRVASRILGTVEEIELFGVDRRRK